MGVPNSWKIIFKRMIKGTPILGNLHMINGKITTVIQWPRTPPVICDGSLPTDPVARKTWLTFGAL